MCEFVFMYSLKVGKRGEVQNDQYDGKVSFEIAELNEVFNILHFKLDLKFKVLNSVTNTAPSGWDRLVTYLTEQFCLVAR